jgi:hypothetical protein
MHDLAIGHEITFLADGFISGGRVIKISPRRTRVAVRTSIGTAIVRRSRLLDNQTLGARISTSMGYSVDRKQSTH